MAVLTIQQQFQDALLKLGDRVELHDPSGRLIGYFLTPGVLGNLQERSTGSNISDEELERSRKRGGQNTVEEVIQRMKAATRAGLEKGE